MEINISLSSSFTLKQVTLSDIEKEIKSLKTLKKQAHFKISQLNTWKGDI